QALAQMRSDYIALQLRSQTIDGAQIPGIGPALKSRLKASRIYSAADVSQHRVIQVPGIGSNKAASLVSWRTKEEFRAKGSLPVALPPGQESTIRARFDAERRGLETRLSG